MKINIRPIIVIDVDGEKCNESCKYYFSQELSQGQGCFMCSFFGVQGIDKIRCQVCLDIAEETGW